MRLRRAAATVAHASLAVCRFCGRLRYELAPTAATFSLTAMSWWHHATGLGWTEHTGYGMAAAATGLLCAKGLEHKNTKAAAVGLGGAVMSADAWIGAALGPSVPSLIATGATTIGAYLMYVPWLVKARHDRMNLQVKAAKNGLLPDSMGINIGAPGVTGDTEEETGLRRALVALGVPAMDVSKIVFTDTGWHAMVSLPAGKQTSAEAVIAKRQQLEANLALPGKLRLAVGPQANQLIVRMQTNDPLERPVVWPGPGITSIEQPMPLGVYPDGSEILLDLVAGHVLLAGGTDMGKSGAVNVIIGNLAACADAQILGIDMKPGALELGPWRRNMLALADDPDLARQVLMMVKAEMIRRGKFLSTLRGPNGEPVRKWTSEHGPYWVLIIDELAELLRQAPDVAAELVTINQVARAMGIRVIAATQSPSEKAFGGQGTDARQQYSTRIGLPVFESTPINMIYGAGAYGAGWRLDWLDLPGKVMVASKRYKEPNEGRCYWVSDAQIVATSMRHATADEPVPETADEPEPEHEPTPPDGGIPGGGRPHLRAVPTFPDGSRIPDNRLGFWEALQKAGPKGLTLPEAVAQGLAGHRTSVQGPFSQWVTKGWVDDSGTRDRAKVYVLTASEHTPSATVPSMTKENAVAR
ncbi:FtsK/SpoIIIE domain-containing protein [Streptomyces sp. NPDC058657]|uniref:FtsK/SpoIIIE domain-containing protein n=1 Tax=unclassified Streptomyces TaxID=2593676 RepID=UPI00365567BA